VRSTLNQYLSVQADDELIAQRGQRLNILITVMSVANLLTLLKDIVFGTVRLDFLAAEMIAFVIFGVLYWYTRLGHRWTPHVLVAFIVLLTPSIFQWDPTSPLVIAMAVAVSTVPLIAPSWLCIPVAVVEVAMLYIISAVFDYPPPNPMVAITIGVLGALSWLSSSSLENALRESRRNASALADTNRELKSSRALLEANAQDLERRSAQLEAAAEVAQAATSILETDRLMRQVVEVIRDRFGLYYVGLFLVDESGSPSEPGGEWAVLQAATGEAGQAMLAPGHRLRVNDDSIVGWSIRHSRARVAQGSDQPLTGHPRPAAALPLRSRGQVLGALSVQSDQPAAFDQDTTVVLQAMADQVAVALDNAHLFSEAQVALEATRRAYGELSREAWARLLRVQPGLGYRSSTRGVTQVGGMRRSEIQSALQDNAQNEPISQDGDVAQRADAALRENTNDPSGPASLPRHPLAVPVKARGHVVGLLDTYKPGDAGDWTPAEIALIEALADQVGQALEGARLYSDTQRRAFHEQSVSEITDKLRRAADMDDLMQTAIQEIAAALGATTAFVQLSAPLESVHHEHENPTGKGMGSDLPSDQGGIAVRPAIGGNE